MPGVPDDDDYRVVLGEECLDWRGLTDAELPRVLDALGDLLEPLADGRKAALMESAYDTECLPSVPLAEALYSPDGGLPPDERRRLQRLLDKCRKIEPDDEDLPQPVRAADGPWREPSWGMAHALARAATGRAMSCVIGMTAAGPEESAEPAWPSGRLTVERNTDTGRDQVNLHILRTPGETVGFWRGVLTRERPPETQFFALTGPAFPQLLFADSLRFHDFKGSYADVLPWLVKLLGLLSDHFVETLADCGGDQKKVQAHFKALGADISPESPNTKKEREGVGAAHGRPRGRALSLRMAWKAPLGPRPSAFLTSDTRARRPDPDRDLHRSPVHLRRNPRYCNIRAARGARPGRALANKLSDFRPRARLGSCLALRYQGALSNGGRMTDTSTGTGNSANQGGQTPGEEADKKSKAVRIAVIGAIGAILATTIPVLLTRDDEKPTRSSDPCDLDRLEAAGELWIRPPAQRSNSKLFADKKPRVLTKVSQDQNPGISVRGQVSLTIPAGQVLYMIRQPDRNTKDQFGNPGSNQYYPVTTVTPDSDGCWEDNNRSLGYDGQKGITEIYYLSLVGQAQADKFAKDREIDEWDGYNNAQWQDVGAIGVLEFRVPTVT